MNATIFPKLKNESNCKNMPTQERSGDFILKPVSQKLRFFWNAAE